MKFAHIALRGRRGLAVKHSDNTLRGRLVDEVDYPGDLSDLIEKGALVSAGTTLLDGWTFDETEIQYLPPLTDPGKIICIGLNYVDHSLESGFKPPEYPTVFTRFSSSLIGHQAPIIAPRISKSLDYEGEIVAVIGRGGRNIARQAALDHVVGYSLFNDVSVRDYQFKTPQWTVGKNFDATGAFGPYLVTADELPSGCAGINLETRLNGEVVQRASTSDLIFDVMTLITTLSEAFTLSAGDIIVTGTPAGVGFARTPPLWLKSGDTCEVRADGLGVLQNMVVNE